MEFSARKTPKSHLSASARHNPYASTGKNFLSKFRNGDRSPVNVNATPPRRSFSKYHKSIGKSNIKVASRARNILQNSQIQNHSKENVKKIKFSPVHENFYSKSNKRTFKSLNTPIDLSDEDDDYDDDELLSIKYAKKVDDNTDKENNNTNHIRAVKVYPQVYSPTSFKKRKPVSLFRSKILHDVSPEKVSLFSESDSTITSSSDKKTFKFKSFGKENEASPLKEDIIEEEMVPHMIGFPNFGNTCYLNAVLQTLVSLPPLISDLSSTVQILNVSETSLGHSLWNVIVSRQKTDLLGVKNALRTMKENVERVDDSFSGYKMQDANEFLTQVLDTIKDEVNNGGCLAPKEDNFVCSTCTPEKLPELIDPNYLHTTENIPTEKLFKKSIFSTPSSSPSCSSFCGSQDFKLRLEDDLNSTSVENVTPIKYVSSYTDNNRNEMTTYTDNNRNEINEAEKSFVNPVTNNFEFELFESFRCLGCGETEGRRQKHFALYVDLPLEDNRSIQEAVESYMSEDQRDLTCEKCGYKRASFLTSFTELPRILIVQMKRYKYNTENLELIKVQSKVDINLWLHLDKLTSSNTSFPPEFVKKPIRFQRRDSKLSTLSVRNLASELNICSSSTPTKSQVEEIEITKENEDEQMEEVLKKSLEDFSAAETEKPEKSEHEKEEEELQTAIKLSLQDLGMTFAEQDYTEETETENENIQVSGDGYESIGTHSYRLMSVISHFGLTTTTGHYVSDILKCDEEKWYHYDDENVVSLSESVIGGEGRQKNGYIFFYVHKNIYDDIRNLTT